MRTVLIITITLGILLPNFLIAQARLGYTESKIKAEFYKQTFENGKTNDGTPFIAFETTESFVIHYFNEEGLSYLCKILPNNKVILNALVERYNREYVIISDTEWKCYNEKGILRIYLIFKDDYAYFEVRD